MNEVITKILTDPKARNESVIEALVLRVVSAASIPWAAAKSADAAA